MDPGEEAGKDRGMKGYRYSFLAFVAIDIHNASYFPEMERCYHFCGAEDSRIVFGNG